MTRVVAGRAQLIGRSSHGPLNDWVNLFLPYGVRRVVDLSFYGSEEWNRSGLQRYGAGLHAVNDGTEFEFAVTK